MTLIAEKPKTEEVGSMTEVQGEIDTQFRSHPLVQQLENMSQLDIDDERPNRFPFHGLDHFYRVASHASSIATTLFKTDCEFRRAAVGVLGINNLSEDEQLAAVQMTYYICGFIHDFGCYLNDDGTMIDLRNDPLNREGHEERSVSELERIVSQEGSEISRILEVLKLDKEKFLTTASLLIGATKVDFTTSTPAIFQTSHFRELTTHPRYALYFRFGARFYAPMIFADLPFAPLPEIWGDLRWSVFELAKTKGEDPHELFKQVYELTLLVNHILFLMEVNNGKIPAAGDIDLKSISGLVQNVTGIAMKIFRPVSLFPLGVIDPSQVSVRRMNQYLTSLKNRGLWHHILNLPYWNPVQKRVLLQSAMLTARY